MVVVVVVVVGVVGAVKCGVFLFSFQVSGRCMQVFDRAIARYIIECGVQLAGKWAARCCSGCSGGGCRNTYRWDRQAVGWLAVEGLRKTVGAIERWQNRLNIYIKALGREPRLFSSPFFILFYFLFYFLSLFYSCVCACVRACVVWV